MKNRKTNNTIIKRTAAAAMGLTMAFGILAAPLPGSGQLSISTIKAYAAEQDIPEAVYGWNFGTFKYGGHTFEYAYKAVSETEVGSGSDEAFVLINVKMGDRTLSIPETVTIDGVTHTVNALCSSFGTGIKAESVLIPGTVTDIGSNVFSGACIGRLTVRGGVKNIGAYFCKDVRDLHPQFLDMDISSLNRLGEGAFLSSSVYNESDNGTVIVNGCLVKCRLKDSTKELNISGLSDAPVTCVADDCFVMNNPKSLKKIDITGVRTLSPDAFKRLTGLAEVTGTDDLKHFDINTIPENSRSYDEDYPNLVKVGNCLCSCDPRDGTIDLTDDRFSGIDTALKGAFKDTYELNTLKLRENEPLLTDSIVSDPYDLKDLEDIYIGGEKVECTAYDQFVPEMIHDHYNTLFSSTKFSRDFAAQKTELIFNELGIDYLGPDSDKLGTLSADKELDAAKKIFDLISTEYHISENGTSDPYEILCTGAEASDLGLVKLYGYMLQCAGVRSEIVYGTTYKTDVNWDDTNDKDIFRKWEDLVEKDQTCAWTLMKIGGQWYQTDIVLSSLICSGKGQYTTNYETFMFTDTMLENCGCEDLHSDREFAVSVHSPYEKQEDLTAYNYADMYQEEFDEISASLGVTPYYGDVNGDFVRDETDEKLIQGFLLASDAVREKITAGTPLSDEDIKSLENIKVCYDDDADRSSPIKLVNADGQPVFDIKQCDLTLDGEYDMADVMLAQQLRSFKSRNKLSGISTNTYVPKSTPDSSGKLPLFDRNNHEACIGETFNSFEQFTFEDFIDLVRRMRELANAPMPAPAPQEQEGPAEEKSEKTDVKNEEKETEKETEKDTEKETEAAVTKGDLNGDSKINVTDISLVASHVKSIKALDAEHLKAADIDGNGAVNVSDISKIAAHVKGISAIG